MPAKKGVCVCVISYCPKVGLLCPEMTENKAILLSVWLVLQKYVYVYKGDGQQKCKREGLGGRGLAIP